ncbi:MAG: YbaN family protein [Amphritea sp.]
MKRKITQTLYLLAGLTCIALGLFGVVLPLLPTTPFVLLAAFCFSRSSDRMHHYLINHPIFGKLLHDWQHYGVIPLKAKILATVMMLLSISYPLFFKDFHFGLKALVVITISCCLTYIWTRPLCPTPGKLRPT